ncbi:hypothetical protein JI664_03535 [Rhodobacter sp. NTK016B]|uniref:hypothetical protein n=1 Tax=Rhodobacter sp. NTK016B TaxID=2759676 RepID=UPI001A8C550C|nr:hypothetical protein [Rhodobacter sp. NTK016B]MBN8291029.1 hypothetical protein [Rhodobacter sp. NTK016B]
MRAPELVAVLLRDGTPLRLCADVNALCDFEAEVARTGLDPLRELARIEGGARATLTAQRALIWACAKDHHEGLTPRDVGALMQTDGAALMAGLSEAMERAAPEKSEDDEPGKPTPPEA